MNINKTSVALLLVVLSVFTLFSASCGNRPPTSAPSATYPAQQQAPVSEDSQLTPATEIALPPGVLAPSQIDSLLIDHRVKVRGEVLVLIENPGGHGGAYVKLGDGKGEVGLRIEPADWDAYTAEEKAKYYQGNTVMAEGMLVLSGQELVVVLGVIPPGAASGSEPSGADYIFMVTVPGNTDVADAVCLEIFNENGNRLGNLKMEQISAYTWRTTYPSVEKTLGYRYNRDYWGFIAGEEFTPDSPDTLRWAKDLVPGQEINDTVTKWRWCPDTGYKMPVIPTNAATATIIPRVNDEDIQCGYGHVDFWWSPFPELYHGTNVAMTEAHATWIKIMPPVGFLQVEPLPKMNWEYGGGEVNNPIYPPGELEKHIIQAQQDRLNVFLIPQCGGVAANGQTFDGDKEYSDEWWEAYINELMEYGTYFAKLAEKCGVKYMAMQDDNMWNSPKAPDDIQERYAEYIRNIRSHYSGKLGMTWGIASFETPEAAYPTGYDPEQFDFLAVGGPSAIASNKDSSVEEMQANFQTMVDSALNNLWKTYRKPIILYSYGVPSCDGGASGEFTHDDDPMQPWSEYTDKYELDLVEQALACEAIMRVIADTPYIIGFYTFNSHWPSSFPLSFNYDMWGKPAVDQVLSKWYQRFTSESK